MRQFFRNSRPSYLSVLRYSLFSSGVQKGSDAVLDFPKARVLSRMSIALLVMLGSAPVALSAQELFQVSYQGRSIQCAVTGDGSMISGRMKNGRFIKDPQPKKLQKKIKRAKKLGDKAKVKKLKTKSKRIKSWIAACIEGHASSNGPGNPGTEIPPPAPGNFSQALAVIKNHCVSCHLNSHAPWDALNSESAWLDARAFNGTLLINQSDLGNSLLLQRTRFYGGTNSTMPQPNLNSASAFSVSDFVAIRDWILSIGGGPPGTVPPEPTPPLPTERSGNELSSAELFQCSGSPEPSPMRYRRMDEKEWTASLGLYGSDAQHNPLVANPNHKYSTYSAGETLNPTLLEQYLNYLPFTRTGWVIGSTSSNVPRPPEHACMIAIPPPSTTCITNFLQVYLKNFVLFRPPTPDELSRLVTFAQQEVAAGDRTTEEGRSAVMQQITSAAWLMTPALFRSEVGSGQDLGGGVKQLSNEELGKALAFTLTDQGPGAPSYMQTARVHPPLPRIQMIEDAVDDGTIGSPATLDALVAANFAGIDPNRESHYSEYWLGEKIERFFREWLEIDSLPTTFHDAAAATSAQAGPGVEGDYSQGKKIDPYYGDEIGYGQQLIEMIARIVNDDEQVIANLFTSPHFYLPSNQDSPYFGTPQYVYGVTYDIAPNRAARWRDLGTIRKGVLGHPAWLASHGANFENGPSAVIRGKFIREKILCQDIPDTPVTVDASFPPSTAHLSARQRLELSTGSAYCQSCHGLMNNLGLAFERYNHAGFVRQSDHGSNPSGAGAITFTGDSSLDGPVASDFELGERFAQSPLVEQCVIRQTFRFFMGRPEKLADACTLVVMRDAYQQSNGSMKAMVQALIKSPAFLMRKQSEAEE